MMNRLNLARAATVSLLATGVFSSARGEDGVSPAPRLDGMTFCAAGLGARSCVRFQGYIFVGRAPASQATPFSGDERLYIHTDDADAR